MQPFMHIPNPAHPAVIHFPIVFIIIGTLVAICSLFFMKDLLTKFAVTIYIIAAIFTYFAEETGGEAYSDLEAAYPEAVPMLHHHADLAGITLKFTAAAAFIGLLALFLKKVKPKLFSLTKIIFVALTIASLYFIYQTSMYGGEMIYGKILKLSKTDLSQMESFEK